MDRIYYRTVKKNRVKILGKILGNKSLKNGELDGKRFCFIIYNGHPDSEWSKNGLTALRGTEALSRAVNKGFSEEELASVYDEDRKILTPSGFLNWYFWEEIKDG